MVSSFNKYLGLEGKPVFSGLEKALIDSSVAFSTDINMRLIRIDEKRLRE
jgi:hypothetical protein